MTSPAPSIKTTIVGSYPVPAWLVALPSETALIDATRTIIATQEAAGIDVVCDGELYRFDVSHPETNGMIEYFTQPMAGIRNDATFDEVIAYRKEKGMAFRARPPGVVDGEISHGTLDLPYAAMRARRLATRPMKFTLTGPHMLAKTLINTHYGDVAELAMAIAGVLAEQVSHINAEIIQIDEANLPGHPTEWEWAAAAINKVLDAVKTTPAVHLCFGNYGGQSVQKGTWAQLIEYLNALHVDHIVMENAHRPIEELAVFTDLRPDIGLGLGVVDIKKNEVESASGIAKSLERASEILGPDRISYINPDCGFWMLPRSVADAKIAALVAGRDLFEGRTSAR
ncbi:MAG: cobalamin-independent methionine synthase II family protein [Alphaproteobacteria bacterium]|nr:cobalamin-independent methionine synthase II family protein [Alphaproteobacteria bacterium]